MKVLYTTFIIFLSFVARSQAVITGTVVQENGESLPGATVRLLKKDSSFVGGTVTDPDGVFTLTVTPLTRYNLLFSYFSYRGQGRMIPLNSPREGLNLGRIELKEAANLREVVVTGVQTRGEQKGDTTSFNASAYKTNPDASAEDLVKKLPGVTSDNTGVKVNGENVQKVLVDGKPFFGDDPNASMKNLPAEMIDRIEVFDKMSDQSAFTGFSDGSQQKTINFVTKKDRNQGYFGKAYAGGGADESLLPRYSSGAAVNRFNGNQRITLLLLSNNVNVQNFSLADISGAVGQSSGGRGMRMGNSPLLSAPQNGNTTTNSGGLNYSDQWGKKISFSGSYFVNNSVNQLKSQVVRSYFTSDGLVYRQNNDDHNDNLNHRLNGRLEFNIDSANRMLLTPSLTYQDNSASSLLEGSNIVKDLVKLGSTSTGSRSDNLAYDAGSGILFQHKLRRIGRTISLSVNGQLSERNNDGGYASSNLFGDSTVSSLDQNYVLYGYTKKLSANVAYTEPAGKKGQIQVSYNPSITDNKSDRTTRDYNPGSNQYTDFNNPLSNKYTNLYSTQRGGVGYKYRNEKTTLEIGTDVQDAHLEGMQQYPFTFTVSQRFTNVLPNAQLNHRFSRSNNMRMWYRTSTNIPSATQLQNVADISNPIQVRSGNPDLKQTFDQNFGMRIGGFNPQTSRNLMLFMNGSATSDYIANGTYILRNDTVIQGLPVKRGAQLTRPLNMQGYYTARSFLTFGFPVKFLKSNVSLSGGFNYSRTPSILNYQKNFTGSYAMSGGVTVGSNISTDLDFTVTYNGSYTIVRNTVARSSDNDFYSHAVSAKINWIYKKRLVTTSDVTHTQYNGLTQSFNQAYFIWNAGIGYKLLKDNSLECRITVYDLLNQNRSISRTVTSAYTEDNSSLVLRRYALFSLTYTFRKFKSGGPPPEMPADQRGGGRFRHDR